MIAAQRNFQSGNLGLLVLVGMLVSSTRAFPSFRP
jgi:hypothetical protein